MGFDKSSSSSYYKKLDMVEAKLHHSKEHRSMKVPTSHCMAWAVPCICFSMLGLTVIFLLQATSMSSCISHGLEISSASYPNLVKLIQDNVLPKLGDGDAEHEGGHVAEHETEEMCKGRHVYMYDVPAQFNEDLAQECTVAGRGPCAESWGCLYCGGLENEGIGVQVPSDNNRGGGENMTMIRQNGYNYNYSIRLRPEEAWYRTHQFSLEVVFHAKMKKYPCLTTDMAMADAFYVPYYAGQDAAVSMKCNSMQLRDRRVNRLLGWLTGQETWQETRGQRHFMVLGRQPLDMNRTITANMWGLPITTQPELANVTFLWWEKAFSHSIHEIGIPYPTSFHPSSDAHLKIWQDTVKGAKREWLVSYLGSARRKFRHESMLRFRQELKRQCDEEKGKCRFMDCTLQYTQTQIPCENEPEIVTLEFSNAIFCLQPEGDTPTRKSIFDSMLAGCIPVVFSNFTAHFQYDAFLPSDPSLYSVFLHKENISLGHSNFVHELAQIPLEKVHLMQDTIREHILPHIIFSLPSSSITFHDAFDLSLQRLFSNLTSLA
eukprot:c24204_g1_i1 orf=834-2471(-)